MSSPTKTRKKREEDVRVESDDDFRYEDLSLGGDRSFLAEGEEDLEAAVRAIQQRAEPSAPRAHRAETVDYFLRNFLFSVNMTETLECFQTEWSEKVHKGLLDPELVGAAVPDVHAQNARLQAELRNAQREREEYRRAASAAADTLLRVQKVRDARRLQHQRVVQEKNRLVEKMRRLKVECESKEQEVKRMSEKCRAVLRQTALVGLERDKVARAAPLQEEAGAGRPAGIQPRPPAPAAARGVRQSGSRQ